MSEYLENSKKFHWGNASEPLNPEKTAILDKYATGKILDLGCAVGRYTEYLSLTHRDVVGVDTEESLLTRALSHYPQLQFVLASASKLPFKKNSFDTVVLFDILEHLDDKQVLKEAMRVAKKVIISVPHENQDFLSAHSLAHQHYMDKTHLREYTPQSLKKLLKESGLKVLYCQADLPVNIYSLAVDYFSAGSRARSIIIKMFLRLFGKRLDIYSTVFAVAERVK